VNSGCRRGISQSLNLRCCRLEKARTDAEYVASRSSISVRSLRVEDGGLYECKALLNEAQHLSRKVRVKVLSELLRFPA